MCMNMCLAPFRPLRRKRNNKISGRNARKRKSPKARKTVRDTAELLVVFPAF